ncbi:MAG: TIM barrel protein [Bacteroidetes bacterium]|nr:TIM barrel protein [Bacteroidota bacterium]MBS1541779.1 TIM barrel protein [Bacteroidota bacterium]
MNNRREFIKKLIAGASAVQIPVIGSAFSALTTDELPPLNISLAQWSMHRAIEKGELKPENFAAIAKNNYGIQAIEYVGSFYQAHATEEKFWLQMKKTANDLGVKNLLIMVDNEGDLGNLNKPERKKAVENHFKWINAAKLLGCHSIRVNAFGDGAKEAVQKAMIESMTILCTYASQENINVIIENHGLYSADGQWVAGIMKAVNQPNCGTLPDFGNWCTNAKWGSTQDNKCTEVYDRYEGVKDFLPFAKGVSAKSYDFNKDGEETIIDFTRMLQLVKAAGFKGHVGIEYEGHRLSEPDGIRATKALLEKTWKKING